jgi:glycosyltransferase involved in cell wall biosynthesis
MYVCIIVDVHHYKIYKSILYLFIMEKVSVIIPTFNRFKFLLNAIESIKSQTYTNIEIIVINDCSTEKEYYEYDWSNSDINMIYLDENTKKIFGYASPGYVRN